jgi:hypothetical protein
VILWGCLVGDAGYGVLQPIVIPELEWKRVRFPFKTGGLKCRHLEWVNVDVRPPEQSGEAKANSRAALALLCPLLKYTAG